MFTPEFVNPEQGEYILVANHELGSPEGVRLSIGYVRARAMYGARHVPAHIRRCRVIYDVRGQEVPAATREHIRHALETHCTVEFKD